MNNFHSLDKHGRFYLQRHGVYLRKEPAGRRTAYTGQHGQRGGKLRI